MPMVYSQLHYRYNRTWRSPPASARRVDDGRGVTRSRFEQRCIRWVADNNNRTVACLILNKLRCPAGVTQTPCSHFADRYLLHASAMSPITRRVFGSAKTVAWRLQTAKWLHEECLFLFWPLSAGCSFRSRSPLDSRVLETGFQFFHNGFYQEKSLVT